MTRTSLRNMSTGQHARITAVKTHGQMSRRIMEMGLIPGAEISITGRAPLKDPVAVKTSGGILTLRNNEADLIFVDIIS